MFSNFTKRAVKNRLGLSAQQFKTDNSIYFFFLGVGGLGPVKVELEYSGSRGNGLCGAYRAGRLEAPPLQIQFKFVFKLTLLNSIPGTRTVAAV